MRKEFFDIDTEAECFNQNHREWNPGSGIALFRCSSLGKLMTNPRTKGEVLSETAKSYIRQIAKEDFYGYNSELNNKYLSKGTNQEKDSIDLLNIVRFGVPFDGYTKNTERITTDLLTGECDIITDETIIDIKTSWSLDTFPATVSEAHDKDYEWQVRGYMMLYGRPKAEVVFCMVSTDPELLTPWDNLSIHEVNHINPQFRVTAVKYERDEEIEAGMIEKLKAAQEYYVSYVNELNEK
jgi:hypothetical protein